MSDMPSLNIILPTACGRRFYAALETAMAAAALGRPVRIFLQGEAAALLRTPARFDGDAMRHAAGQPDLASLIAEAIAMNVRMVVCQSGMALTGMAASNLAPQVRTGGLVSFLAEASSDGQLLTY